MYKFALIGCGDIAGLHAQQITKYGQLKAVCDVLPDRADQFASSYGARAWYNADDLIRNEMDIDVIVVCTPNGFHAEHCIKSLQADRVVLCESPLCLTTAAAWQMIETEKFCRKKLFVADATIHNSKLSELKRTIDGHTHDHFYSFDMKAASDEVPGLEKEWQGEIFPGGGSLYTYFTRYIETLLYLFGEIDEAKTFCANLRHEGLIDVEDTGEASLKMKNGIPGNLAWSLADAKQEAALQILTLKNPVSFGGLEDTIAVDAEAYAKFYEHMIDCIQTNQPSNLYQATKTVEAIEKIYKAASSNQATH